MSERECLLQPGDSVVVVTGVADVIAVAPDGSRFPLGSLSESDRFVQVGAATRLLIVPRADCTIARTGAAVPQSEPGVDKRRSARLIGGWLSDPGVVNRVERASDDLVDQIVDVELSRELDVRQWAAESAQRARQELGSHERNASVGAIRDLITRPARKGRPEAVCSELETAFRIVGDDLGFEVPVAALTRVRDRDPVEYLARRSKVNLRKVRLGPSWDRRAEIPMIAYLRTSGRVRPVALLPRRGSFRIQSAADRESKPLTAELVGQLEPVAYEIFAPLPRDRAVTIRDLGKLALRNTGAWWVWVIAMSALLAALSLVTPALTQWVMGTIVPLREHDLLVQVGIGLVILASATLVFSLVQSFTIMRIDLRAGLRVQTALWSRMLELPAGFFRQYNTGDLAQRTGATTKLVSIFSAGLVSHILGSVFALSNFVLLVRYDSQLALVVAGILVVATIATALTVIPMRRWSTRRLAARRAANGSMIQLLSGIQKIRMAGLEDRMVVRQLDKLGAVVELGARQGQELAKFRSFFAAMSALIPLALFATIGMTWDGGPPISQATYLAFMAAFGTLFGAVTALAGLVQPAVMFGPLMDQARPVLEALPESATHRVPPGELRGEVEFRNVTFGYDRAAQPAVRGLSFRAAPGEMIAIVGPTGCGKTSTVRMLLGFESPDAGQVLYDGQDLEDLDLDDVRSQVGVVIQDGKINLDSVLNNIIAGAGASVDSAVDEMRAWRAAEQAGLAEDIRAMPMGMRTLISPVTISGGQAQKVLLARAFAKSPAVVILDEATSALDNLSQATVTESLRNLGCTRIVIAHRLSTIAAADRVLVLRSGELVESGSYDELSASGGLFGELVQRQLG